MSANFLARLDGNGGPSNNGAQSALTLHHPLLDSLLERTRVHGNHSKRVRALAIQLGISLSLTTPELTDLSYGALLHDVGKVHVRVELLEGDIKIDRESEDWRLMKEHSENGAALVREHGLSEAVVLAVRHHHESYDGTGYPSRLAGSDIPLLARIVTLVDSWDTMTSMRLYNTPRTHDDAIAELERCAGTQFDPELVRLFAASRLARSGRRAGRSSSGAAGNGDGQRLYLT